MGNFVHHLSGSVIAGGACSAASYYLFHTDYYDTAAIGAICAISGLLPDVDSPYSKPTEHILSISSALAPSFVLQYLSVYHLTPSQILIIAVGSFLLVRFGLRVILKHVTVHRGMFHSIPAAIIWGCIVFLSFSHSPEMLRNMVASAAALGFIVHLLIDEMFSLVDISGGTFEPKKSAGTAFKFFSPSSFANFLCYGILFFLLYLCYKQSTMLQLPV